MYTWKVKSVEKQMKEKQEGNVDPALKPDFYIFLLIFQNIWRSQCGISV